MANPKVAAPQMPPAMRGQVDSALAQIGEIASGRLVQNISLGAGATTVQHGLGRPPRGALIVRLSGSGYASCDGFNNISFTITSSAANVTADVWVF